MRKETIDELGDEQYRLNVEHYARKTSDSASDCLTFISEYHTLISMRGDYKCSAFHQGFINKVKGDLKKLIKDIEHIDKHWEKR